MKATINVYDIMIDKLGETPSIPATIDIGEVFQFMDADEEYEVDIEDLLADQQTIGVIWNVQLVLEQRPELTTEQAWSVLQACQPRFEEATEPMLAIVRQIADEMFPPKRTARPSKVAQIIADYAPNGDERDNLLDLLADAMHWCDAFGEPFEEFEATARLHFVAEAKATKKGA